MQRFIEGVRSFELKRHLALFYAQEQYVYTPPTVKAIRFTVQQYLRIRELSSTRAAATAFTRKSTKPDIGSAKRSATSTAACGLQIATAASMF